MHLYGKDYTKVHLYWKDYTKVHLYGKDYTKVHLYGADYTKVHLYGADYTKGIYMEKDIPMAFIWKYYTKVHLNYEKVSRIKFPVVNFCHFFLTLGGWLRQLLFYETGLDR